ncbi:hypothetical protein B0T14DRAFT_562268 [Immersiella caudata]|uniref:Uncharacterized protein n=1 Tax=Immersiella caudata TaxID=314043 RepID=A0AA39X300_9PEZI|nr:hypothetical protein B0T14DRAFT_562268 [Immersiella caudata]
MAEQLCISHFKEEYIAQGEREREVAEQRRNSQPFKQHFFNPPAHRGRKHNTNSETESDTATETESEQDKNEPARAGPRRFTDSQLSSSAAGKREDVQSKSISAPSKREWQRASPAFKQASSEYTKRKKEKQPHWADDTSPRGSKVGSITESLVAENGESYVGFAPEDGGPGGLPGSYPVGGGGKPVGTKRTNSMPSESGSSTATTRVV